MKRKGCPRCRAAFSFCGLEASPPRTLSLTKGNLRIAAATSCSSWFTNLEAAGILILGNCCLRFAYHLLRDWLAGLTVEGCVGTPDSGLWSEQEEIMFCDGCGTAVQPGQAFCVAAGNRSWEPWRSMPARRRPRSRTSFNWSGICGGDFCDQRSRRSGSVHPRQHPVCRGEAERGQASCILC